MYKKINSQGLTGWGPASCMASIYFKTSQHVSLTIHVISLRGDCQNSKAEANCEGEAKPVGCPSNSAIAVALWSGSIKKDKS